MSIDSGPGLSEARRRLHKEYARRYDKAAELAAPAERQNRISELAWEFMYEPLNIEIQVYWLNRWAPEFGGDLDQLDRDVGDLTTPFNKLVKWFPELSEAEGDLGFRWDHIVLDWAKKHSVRAKKLVELGKHLVPAEAGKSPGGPGPGGGTCDLSPEEEEVVGHPVKGVYARRRVFLSMSLRGPPEYVAQSAPLHESRDPGVVYFRRRVILGLIEPG